MMVPTGSMTVKATSGGRHLYESTEDDGLPMGAIDCRVWYSVGTLLFPYA